MPQALVLAVGGLPPCWTSINNPSSEGSLGVSNTLSTSRANTLHTAGPGQARG